MNKVLKFPLSDYELNMTLYGITISNLGVQLAKIEDLDPQVKFNYLNKIEILKTITNAPYEGFKLSMKEALDEINEDSLERLGKRSVINDLIDALYQHFNLRS